MQDRATAVSGDGEDLSYIGRVLGTLLRSARLAVTFPIAFGAARSTRLRLGG